MLGKVEIEEHYSTLVYVNTMTESLRRSECLCLNCESMKSCEYAKAFYELCIKGNIALMVTRCYHATLPLPYSDE